MWEPLAKSYLVCQAFKDVQRLCFLAKAMQIKTMRPFFDCPVGFFKCKHPRPAQWNIL